MFRSKVRIIGDVHCKFNAYMNIAGQADYSIQIGDFGIGLDDPLESTVIDWLDENRTHTFFRGNHDNYQKCQTIPGFMEDGTYMPKWDLMVIGGAKSVDSNTRFSGISKWDDEEVSFEKWERIFHIYEAIKPRILLTHDFPSEVVRKFFGKDPIKSRTQQALDSILSIHKPNLWIGGHYHVSKSTSIDGTAFHCLNELEYLDI